MPLPAFDTPIRAFPSKCLPRVFVVSNTWAIRDSSTAVDTSIQKYTCNGTFVNEQMIFNTIIGGGAVIAIGNFFTLKQLLKLTLAEHRHPNVRGLVLIIFSVTDLNGPVKPENIIRHQRRLEPGPTLFAPDKVFTMCSE